MIDTVPICRRFPLLLRRRRRSIETQRRHAMTPVQEKVTVEFLQAFADAWNRHDADALMQFMTEDCVFESSSGPDVCGTRYEGSRAVRQAFADVWKGFPDAQWLHARHFIDGDRGLSEW